MKKLIIGIAVIAIVLSATILFRDEYSDYVDDYNVNSRLRREENQDIVRVYQTKNDSFVYIVETEGYNPELILLVEVEQSEVKSLEIISHNETDDYGGYADNEWFLSRFLDKTVDKFELVKMKSDSKEQIVAVTGATFTSKAIVEAVNLCLENYGGLK
ncbi:MAG: FMN-binding protein [Clostridia bacterium]